MKYVLALLILTILTYSLWGQAGTTVVSAQVKDSNGSLYVNCQWSAVFVGENMSPNVGPYGPPSLLNGQQGTCDSQANLSLNLADNINTVTPTPSQWSFSICSAQGYVAGPYCKANILITITGASQNISSTLTPLLPLLPSLSGSVTAGTAISITGLNTVNLASCGSANQVWQWNGSTWVCATVVGGGNVSTAPAAAQNIIQPVSSGHTTQFTANNQSGLRWVTPSYNWSYTDSSGSLGNLTSAGTNLTITLPCSAGSPCPAGLDTTFNSFSPGGTVSMSNGSAVVTNTGANFFSNYVQLAVSLPGCAAGGGTLISNIVSWQSATQVTLATPATNATGCSGVTMGIASYVYSVYISGTGTAEAVPVLGGTCTAGATASCTLIISTANAHPNGYTISSASQGIQEAENDAWTADAFIDATSASSPDIRLMPGTIYNVRAAVYIRGNSSKLEAKGATIGCFTRDYCVYIGGWRAHPATQFQSVTDALFAPGINPIVCSSNTYCNVSSVSEASGLVTVTTSANHSFNGPTNGIGADTVSCEIYSTNVTALKFVGKIQAVTSNTLTFSIDGSSSFSAGAYTFGFCRLLMTALEDNGDHVNVDNFQSQIVNTVNGSGAFGYAITNENDQHFMVRGVRGGSAVDSTYPVGAFFYQRTDRGYAGIFNISDVEMSGVNCYTGGGNGAIWNGGVCQGFPVFGVRYFGVLQPITILDVYQESTGSTTNPLYGYAAAAAYELSGSQPRIIGAFPTGGTFPTFNCVGGGAQTQRNYYVIAWNGSGAASPLLYIGSSSASNCSGVNVPLVWPSPNVGSGNPGAITWSIAVTTGSGTVPPYVGQSNAASFILGSGASGSASPTCGSNGMCTFTDTQAAGSSGTVPGPTYPITFWFWPAPFVNNGSVILTDIAGSPSGEVSSNGDAKVSMIGLQCGTGISQEKASAAYTQCLGIDPNAFSATISTIFTQLGTSGAGPPANLKGALNFGPEMTNIGDILTLADSTFHKTTITTGYRPSSDSGDWAFCRDQSGGLCQRAPTSISTYINSTGDNSSFKERLTSTFKSLAVPFQAIGTAATLSGTGACASRSTQQGGAWAGQVTCTGTTGASTLVITPGGTAGHGFECHGSDTTSALAGGQSGISTTTCTLSFTTVTANDVISFGASAYQ